MPPKKAVCYQFCPGFTHASAVMSVFSGRAEEVKRIVHGIDRGNNLLIEGETRIGKTFLTCFLEDLTDHKIDDYRHILIDQELRKEIKELKPILSRIAFLNISLHALNDPNVFLNTLLEKMLKSLRRESPFGFSKAITPTSFLSTIEHFIYPFLNSKKIVLMLDEFEKISTAGYSGRKTDILGCLCEVIQSFPNIRLIVLGWNGMEERMRKGRIGRISDFFDQIDRRIYVTPLSVDAARSLICKVGGSVFGMSVPANIVLRSLDYTGCRPFYIQKYFDMINEKINVTKRYRLEEFSRNKLSQEEIEEELSVETKFTIAEALKGGDTRSKILLAIAEGRGVSKDFLAYIVGDSFFEREIEELERHRFIIRIDGLYTIQADLYRTWILKNIRNPFVQREKAAPDIKTDQEFVSFVEKLISQFKHSVEEKAGYKLLWKDSKTPASEENSQILFRLLFEKFAGQHGVFLHREVETGRGPVDFKFAGGFDWSAHLEMKRADSSQLRHGLKKQLPTYLKADEVKFGFYCVIAYNLGDIKKADEIALETQEIERKSGILLRTFVIDAGKKKSASK